MTARIFFQETTISHSNNLNQATNARRQVFPSATKANVWLCIFHANYQHHFRYMLRPIDIKINIIISNLIIRSTKSYTGSSCLSARLGRESCPFFIFYNTCRVHFKYTPYQATSEGVSSVKCFSQIDNLKCWQILQICNFDFA